MEPTAADSVSVLAEECRGELDRCGFVVVPEFLSEEEVASGRESFARLAPTAEQVLAEGKDRFALLQDHPPPDSFGTMGMRQWPYYDDDVLVDQATSPRLASLVKQILGVEELRLGPFALLFWAKYAGLADFDQAMHMDRIGFLYPQPRGPRRSIRCWLYYSDIDEDSGPTCLLPLEYAKDLPLSTIELSREQYPELYEHEVAAVGPAGTLLMWTNPGVFHRGSAMGAPPAYRWVSGSDFQAAGCDWMGSTGPLHRVSLPYHLRPWTRGPQAVMQRFLSRTTPEQRTLFGVPPPGDAYWDEHTIAGTADEYPGMDMAPYLAAL